MSTNITAASTSLTASSGQVDATVNIPTAYTASVAVSIDSCTLPSAPGDCWLQVLLVCWHLGRRPW
jgi:hypothetical protein